MSDDIKQLVEQLAGQLLEKKRRVCTAESCTGGLIAKSFTDLAGSSAWFERGFVTYSNEAKTEMLGVDESVINLYGAVSEAVASAMARGALQHSAADYAIAVTGVAGPDGGSVEKPVGTVWLGLASKNQAVAEKFQLKGDRHSVREQTLLIAVRRLIELMSIER